MKKILSFVLILAIVCSTIPTFVTAETITIDPETASYDELVETINILEDKRIQRLKEQFAADLPEPSSDGITFRGVPFLTLKPEAEQILGGSASYYQNRVTSPSYYNVSGGPIGIEAWYRDWSVAGYNARTINVDYVYPVVDGIMLHDDELAIFYQALYYIEANDTQSAVADFIEKLTSLYGKCSYTDKGYPIWEDKDGNSVIIYSFSTDVIIVYRSYNAFELTDIAKEAYNNEQALQEAEKRIKNQGNVDGL